jgi:hypothetical protein
MLNLGRAPSLLTAKLAERDPIPSMDVYKGPLGFGLGSARARVEIASVWQITAIALIVTNLQ